MTLPGAHAIVPRVMKATWVLALAGLSFAGCRTKFEAVTCDSDADCTAEEYHCDTAQERCVRRTCQSTADCAQEYGYTCEVKTGRCVLAIDGGPDGSTSCDRDADGADGPQCGGDDCDDDDPARAPDHVELCNAGVDDDCDELTSEGVDADADHYCAGGGPSACCEETEVDCCDTDEDAHPGVTAFFTVERDCGGFDYDCSGAPETQFSGFGGCTCSMSTCSQTPGWSGTAPSCGGLGDRVSGCTGEPCAATCTTTTTPVTQGCH